MEAASGDLPVAAPNNSDDPAPRALSSAQERRLVNYLDEHILQIQGEYKKRNYETSTLRTLSAYLKAIRPLMSLILMIPPIDQSASLRVALLLRLTGEILECAPGYPPDDLLVFLEVLDELDRGWLAVLRSQVWNPEAHSGEDLMMPAEMILNSSSSSMSQTDRTRLRSLLIAATDKLEEWLESQVIGEVESAYVRQSSEIQQRFDNIFHSTLSEMGELRGGG